MNHVMLDLETLGTSADAVILSIAAVRFDPYNRHTFEGYSELEFYRTGININQEGRKVDDGTFRWWMRQDGPARKEHSFKATTGLGFTLFKLQEFLKAHEVAGVWGNGADFDNAIIQHAWSELSATGSEPLYPFWTNRCFRTFKSLFDPDKQHEPVSNDHNALHDCRNQIEWMWNIVEATGVENL